MEEDVEIRHPLKRVGGRLLAAYGLYCADEALSVVRHDVLNRMTAVGALSYELRQMLPAGVQDPGGAARQRLDDLNRQVGLMTEVVGRRLASAADAGASSRLDAAVSIVQALLETPISVTAPEGLALAIGGRELEVVLLAVLSNALDAAPPGEARIAVRATETGDDRVRLEIEDFGSGLTEEGLERAFERFFTSRPGHAGLGLSVARTLVLRAGGDIGIANRSDGPGPRGARVRIELPLGEGTD